MGIIRVIFLLLTFCYGIAVGNYHIFPYGMFKKAKDFIIGIPILKKTYLEMRPEISQYELIKGQGGIVMFGDSLTEDGLWAEFMYPHKVFNRGISGDNLSHMLLRLDYILKLNPQVVFVQGGINDFFGNKSVSQVMESYRSIVKELTQHKIEVVIQSTVPCSTVVLSSCDKILAKVTELNRELRNFARSHNVPYLDLNSTLSTPQQGLKKEYTNDGVHLLGNAYFAWSGIVLNYLKNRP